LKENLSFQYCQKLVVLDDEDRVLLARRKGEADYDGTYSFVGGKAEVSDGGILEAMKREKVEEIGRRALILVAPYLSFNVYFTKKDGNAMILPHVYARYVSGAIDLNEEYSDYKWVPIAELRDFEPKIDTIPEAVAWAKKLGQIITEEDLYEI
jgi:8-oxo-dGTP pyrophosphatase MutT (NUDIX family)